MRISRIGCETLSGNARIHGSGRSGRAFTLIELLVVVAVISLLVAIVLPSLARARSITRRTICLTNLHAIGVAIYMYADGNNNCMPFGPKAPPMMSAMDFYPSTGAPTSLISLTGGSQVGLGLMLRSQLANQPRVLFCPGGDQSIDEEAELAKAGSQQAQCSYYYRHASVARQFDPPGVDVLSPDHVRLDSLGSNRNGQRIRALVMDSQFLVSANFSQFGVTPRTHHQQECANVLYSDGHAVTCSNADGRFTVNLDSYQALTNAFDKILGVLEKADVEP